MTRVYNVRLVRQCLTRTAERLLIDLPGKIAVLTGSVAEKRDYACRADEDVGGSAQGEHPYQAGPAQLFHLVRLSF